MGVKIANLGVAVSVAGQQQSCHLLNDNALVTMACAFTVLIRYSFKIRLVLSIANEKSFRSISARREVRGGVSGGLLAVIFGDAVRAIS